jgi:phosphatidylinositol phospholipase C delta
VDLEKVVRVQVGQMTAPFVTHAKTFEGASDRSISVIYTDDIGVETSLDLLAPNDHVFKYINRVIRKVVADLNEEKRTASVEKRYLKAKWEAADSDNNGYLTRREIIGIVSGMNINRTRAKIIEIFNAVDADASGELDFNEFQVFMQRVRRR